LCKHIKEILKKSDYPEEKAERTELMIRRVLGRANLTPCEAQTIRGVLRHLEYHVNKSKGIDVSKKIEPISNIFERDDFEI